MSFLTEEPILTDALLPKPFPPAWGACVSFAGAVRHVNEGRRVSHITYSAYRPLAEKEIEKLIVRVKANTGVAEIRVAHRLGQLHPGDTAVLIWAFSIHRKEAFRACENMIELLKESVPIWKKEIYAEEVLVSQQEPGPSQKKRILA